MSNLSEKTVIELRKLAKELHVPLSAGISKQGIVERLTAAMAAQEAESASPAPAETVPVEAPEQVIPAAEEKAVTTIQPDSKPDPEVKAEPATKPEPEPKPETAVPTAARTPTPLSRFNSKPAYQAAPGNNRGPMRPAAASPIETQRTQTTRPVSGFTPRFGPTASVESAPAREEERFTRPEPRQPIAERRPSFGAEASRFQQRPAYEARPAFEQPTRPAERPVASTYTTPRREPFAATADAPAAPQAVGDMLTAAECLDGSGVLELHADGYGFLRGESLLPSSKDIYLSQAQVRRFSLRNGDHVSGKTRPAREGDKVVAMLYVTEVNGISADDLPERPAFEDLTAVYPTRRIDLQPREGEKFAGLRLLDLFTPIGFGQRALVQCPAGMDKHRMFTRLANVIAANHPDASIMALRYNVTPEDVTEFREEAACIVYATTFDMPPENHLRLTDLVLERAERLAEAGQDVVLLVDSLTTLAKVFTAAAIQQYRPTPGAMNPTSLFKARKFFGAARALREGGSLTIIAAMDTETGNKVDEAIVSEFAAAANMSLLMDPALIQANVYPPIDLRLSGTRRAELLASPEQREAQRSIRSMLSGLAPEKAMQELVALLDKTDTNDDLFTRIQEWARAVQG